MFVGKALRKLFDSRLHLQALLQHPRQGLHGINNGLEIDLGALFSQ